ncbi:hypothetical protein C2845_PM09G13600 [Panicum miliaceum]|uniref:Uncharacterized protein n=1 Tax=Panicum miliaceum TaxID=4540 RepID=A0A3L6S2R1_PANMI|nr:hypothetical protein C2845_PM09G13600 [Panicum miliaceum]
MVTRGKGKEAKAASNEAVEQYKRLREDELRLELMYKQIQEKKRALEFHVHHNTKTQKELRAESTYTNRGVPTADHHRGPAPYISRLNRRIKKKSTTGAEGQSTESHNIVMDLASRSRRTWRRRNGHLISIQ